MASQPISSVRKGVPMQVQEEPRSDGKPSPTETAKDFVKLVGWMSLTLGIIISANLMAAGLVMTGLLVWAIVAR